MDNMMIPVTIHYQRNNEYPDGFTIAKTFKEALAVAYTLTQRTQKSWAVIDGDLYWKNRKPAFYICYAVTEQEKTNGN